jgi:hypothetical protein
MAAPNLIGAATINGKTTGANLSTTAATSILSNAANSGKCLKINTLNAANFTATAANISINFNTAAALAGTNLPIANTLTVPAYSTLSIIDKSTQYYLEENQSIGATAGTSNAITITISYEDIS